VGRLLLISRLVLGDIKRRRVQSALLLLMIVTTTATLTLGLAVRKTSETPFARTRAATRGPDIVAELQPNPGSRANPTGPFEPLLHARGIRTSGPYPVAFVRLASPGIDVPVQAEGRDSALTPIDRPLITTGHWVASSAVNLHRRGGD
jgi:putative ABC transport system permease protein